MPGALPSHYLPQEFHKLPTKINESPAILFGLRSVGLTVVGVETLILVLLTVIVSSNALALLGTAIIGLPTVFFTGLLFWISYTRVRKTYTQHLRFMRQSWKEPPHWTGDAFRTVYGRSPVELGVAVEKKASDKGKGKKKK